MKAKKSAEAKAKMAAKAQKAAPTIEEVKEKAKKERKEEAKKMKFRETSIIDYLKSPKSFRFKELRKRVQHRRR